MIGLIEDNRQALEALCVQYRVACLEVFGSAADGTFDPATSDLDFLVEFKPMAPGPLADAYFGLLDDIRDEAEFILDQTRGRSLDDYAHDRLLSAAVERNFITIGEAFRRLSKTDAEIGSFIDDYPQIIGFRNVVVHGYDVIEDAIVWGVIQN